MKVIKKIISSVLFRQILSFLFVSGIGWLIDFGVFFVLTTWLGFSVFLGNCISAVPGILWVFWFSSRHIFTAKKTGLKLYQKYLIYFAYQALLVAGVSLLAGYLFTQFIASRFVEYELLYANIKMVIKIAITPITMTMNFIIMKLLLEKL